MDPQIGWRWLARLAGVVLAVTAGLLLFSVPACASCGDYVMMHDSVPTHTAQDFPVRPLPAPLASSPSQPFPSRHQAPCRGPNCRGTPGPAPLAPISPAPSVGEEGAWLAAQPLLPRTGESRH